MGKCSFTTVKTRIPLETSGKFNSLHAWSQRLGLGQGLVDQDIPGPRKKEGDGRTPAGLFPLPFVFGYDSSVTAKQSGVRMPYFELNVFHGLRHRRSFRGIQ
jgi:L,D-peptidoglycan transpeptidase YkuD (ErfK/YbiS/YcfS/YnhG family)